MIARLCKMMAICSCISVVGGIGFAGGPPIAGSISVGETPISGGRIHQPFALRKVDQALFSGPLPRQPSDFQQLRAAGVTQIIDMRGLRPLSSLVERRRAARYGIVYRKIPIGFLPLRRGNLPQIMAEIQPNAGCGAIFFHCTLGRDRTGLVTALYQNLYQGVPAGIAYAQWKSQQFNRSLDGLDKAFNRYAR